MKTIDNKTTNLSFLVEGKEKKMTYKDILKLILDLPPEKGYSITEMRQRLKIYAEIEPDKKNKINLEDADFSILKKLVLDFKWAQHHKDIVAFVDHIESLK